MQTKVEVLSYIVEKGWRHVCYRKIDMINEVKLQQRERAPLVFKIDISLSNIHTRIREENLKFLWKDIKKAMHVWTEKMQEEFATWNVKLRTDPVLACTDHEKSCMVQTDVSNKAIGAVLSHLWW